MTYKSPTARSKNKYFYTDLEVQAAVDSAKKNKINKKLSSIFTRNHALVLDFNTRIYP